MVRAFIMVDAAAGHAEAVVERIRSLSEVEEANVVAGDFDVIVEATDDEVYDLISEVATEIRSFDDVNDTKTYVCLE